MYTIASGVAAILLVAALLYYYVYVATYARFQYFGVDMAMLRTPTRDLVIRNVAALYVPCVFILASTFAFLVMQNATRLILLRSNRRAASGAGWLAVLLGASLLLQAVIGIAAPNSPVADFPAATPLALGVGSLFCWYGRYLLHRATQRTSPSISEVPVFLLVAGAVTLSAFWAAGIFATAYGYAQAKADSVSLEARPSITLDASRRIHTDARCAEETALPPNAEGTYQYRYRGFRLLAVGQNRLMLIPDRWRDGCGVVIVSDDDSIRLQFNR